MKKKSPKINLNDSSHTFIIAEAGSNWKVGNYNKDLKQAKKLIETAKKCGADAIKFQTYSSKGVYVSNAGKSKYLSKFGVNKKITELFDEFSMPHKMIKQLSSYCKNKKIIFMSTAFSIDDAQAVDEYVPIHKIASYEINHIPLLKFLAKTKKPLILSTGASTLEEIDFAIKIIKKAGNNDLALLQCTAKYPAPIESMNLSVIPSLKKKYHIPLGLSDHSIDPIIAPLVAIGFGASIIEKHFTLNKNLAGPDHFFALEPKELTTMIKAIRSADKAKGNSVKEIVKEEKELRKFAVRSIQAIKNIQKGEKLKIGYNIDILRPGNQSRGMEARFLHKINGKNSLKKIKSGAGIKSSDCK